MKKTLASILCLVCLTACYSELEKNSNRMIEECAMAINQGDLVKAVGLLDSLSSISEMTSRQQKKYSELIELSAKNEDMIFLIKGWNYILNRLKCPSTASLVGFLSPDSPEMKEHSDEKYKVAAFRVDAQNGYGAMLRKNYYVYFKDGEPAFSINDDDIEYTRNSIRSMTENIINRSLYSY